MRLHGYADNFFQVVEDTLCDPQSEVSTTCAKAMQYIRNYSTGSLIRDFRPYFARLNRLHERQVCSCTDWDTSVPQQRLNKCVV